MPREWPFAGPLAAWRTTCANAEPARVRVDAADAFVDRTPIDWTTLLTRVRGRDLMFVENLRLLDLLRRRAPPVGPASHVQSRSSLPTCLVLAIASLQTVCGLSAVGIALAGGQGAYYRTWQYGLGLPFFLAWLLL